jgi:hypothetical protein
MDPVLLAQLLMKMLHVQVEIALATNSLGRIV